MCLAALAASAQIERPRLVVGLAIDQMRWDYLYYYYDDYGKGGLKRLLDEGFSCANTMIPYTPTVTAVGHTTLYTGSVPALHGIAGNDFQLNGKFTYCCTDTTVQSVGSNNRAGQMSPRNLLATTIGDQLKIATDYRSKVIGIALKDRAAILPAGHSADAAYWWDQQAGHYVSSTYYMNELPKWVRDFNKRNHTEPGFDIKTNVKGITVTFSMAEAAMKNERLGRHDDTDMLCLSVSSTDAIGHTFSTRGPENKAAYMQLDKDLAHFFAFLDDYVGKGNYLFFLSADHGGAHNPNQMNDHKIPAGGYDAGTMRRDLNAQLQQKFGVANLFNGRYAFSLYLDHAACSQAGLDETAVKAEAVKFLKEQKDVLFAADMERVSEASIPEPIKQMLINGYFRGRSGDVQVVARPGYIESVVTKDYKGTTHSAWNPYDAHIPLVFMGWNVKQGETTRPTKMTDVAATVCAMLHIQAPNACVGTPIETIVAAP